METVMYGPAHTRTKYLKGNGFTPHQFHYYQHKYKFTIFIASSRTMGTYRHLSTSVCLATIPCDQHHTLSHSEVSTDLATIDALEEPNFRKLALIC